MKDIIELKRYRKNYNKLPDDVEKAYKLLRKRRNLDKILGQAVLLIESHKASDYAGIFLLHRHFKCQPNTLFVERTFRPDDAIPDHPPVLVTRPVQALEIGYEIIPYRFSFSKKCSLNPLEFNAGDQMKEQYEQLKKNKSFITAIGSYFIKHKLTDQLGISLVKKKSLLDTATKVFFEHTNIDQKESVVHQLPHLPLEADRITPTLWTFEINGEERYASPAACGGYCSHGKDGTGYCGHKRKEQLVGIVLTGTGIKKPRPDKKKRHKL